MFVHRRLRSSLCSLPACSPASGGLYFNQWQPQVPHCSSKGHPSFSFTSCVLLPVLLKTPSVSLLLLPPPSRQNDRAVSYVNPLLHCSSQTGASPVPGTLQGLMVTAASPTAARAQTTQASTTGRTGERNAGSPHHGGYSAPTGSEVLTHAIARLGPGNIPLSERSQAQKAACWTSPCPWSPG